MMVQILYQKSLLSGNLRQRSYCSRFHLTKTCHNSINVERSQDKTCIKCLLSTAESNCPGWSNCSIWASSFLASGVFELIILLFFTCAEAGSSPLEDAIHTRREEFLTSLAQSVWLANEGPKSALRRKWWEPYRKTSSLNSSILSW